MPRTVHATHRYCAAVSARAGDSLSQQAAHSTLYAVYRSTGKAQCVVSIQKLDRIVVHALTAIATVACRLLLLTKDQVLVSAGSRLSALTRNQLLPPLMQHPTTIHSVLACLELSTLDALCIRWYPGQWPWLATSPRHSALVLASFLCHGVLESSVGATG